MYNKEWQREYARRKHEEAKPAYEAYLRVDLYIDGKQKQCSVHALVAKAFIPNPEGKPEVNHIVGCKFNCHVSNLE